MIRILVVEPVPAPRASGALQIRWVAVDELRALERIVAEEPVRSAVHELNGVVALERIKRPCISVDADVAHLPIAQGFSCRDDLGGVPTGRCAFRWK